MVVTGCSGCIVFGPKITTKQKINDMPTKKKTGTSIDRKIASVRKKISEAKAKQRAEKAMKRKESTLKKLQNQAKRIGATTRTTKRRSR